MLDKLQPLFVMMQYLGVIILAVASSVCVYGLLRGDRYMTDAGALWSLGGGLMFVICFMMN